MASTTSSTNGSALRSSEKTRSDGWGSTSCTRPGTTSTMSCSALASTSRRASAQSGVGSTPNTLWAPSFAATHESSPVPQPTSVTTWPGACAFNRSVCSVRPASSSRTCSRSSSKPSRRTLPHRAPRARCAGAAKDEMASVGPCAVWTSHWRRSPTSMTLGVWDLVIAGQGRAAHPGIMMSLMINSNPPEPPSTRSSASCPGPPPPHTRSDGVREVSQRTKGSSSSTTKIDSLPKGVALGCHETSSALPLEGKQM